MVTCPFIRPSGVLMTVIISSQQLVVIKDYKAGRLLRAGRCFMVGGGEGEERRGGSGWKGRMKRGMKDGW